MLNVSKIGSASSAASYYTQTEQDGQRPGGETVGAYYTDKGEIQSKWEGAGAELAGIDGKTVTKEDLQKMLEGQVKEVGKDGNISEKQLGRTVDGEKQHAAGWDLQFSAPKSVSIEAGVWGKEDVRAAHEKAVDAGMKFMEEKAAQARVYTGERDGKGNAKTEKEQTGSLTYAKFEHGTSREKDPQLHTHVLVMNVTHDKNGTARSLSSEGIYAWKGAADEVYKNALAQELQKAGYQLEHNKNGFEIKGYSKENIDQFSKRSDQIEKALEKRGETRETASRESRQVASYQTRQDKQGSENAAAYRDGWQKEAKENGMKGPAERSGSLVREKTPDQIVSRAIQHLSERETRFSEKDVWTQSMKFSEGQASKEQIQASIEKAQQKGDLIQRAPSDYQQQKFAQDAGGKIFTTADAMKSEKDMVKMAESGKGKSEAVMSEKQFEEALKKFESQKGFQLSSEQKAAAGSILTSSDKYQAVQGLAGTGKTTMLEFVRTSAESQGWKVEGFSQGAAQAQKMEQESGISSKTTASFLESQKSDRVGDPKMEDNRRTLRVMDEASLSGQRELTSVMKASEKDGSKTVFLGDRHQHQGVESGQGFEILQKHVATTNLSDIRRQTTDEAKDAVSHGLGMVQSKDPQQAKEHAEALFSKHSQEVKSDETRAAESKWAETQKDQGGKLEAQQRSEMRAELSGLRAQDNKQVVEKMARDFASKDQASRDSTLIVSASRADRDAINSAVRTELKEKGELQGGREMSTLQAKDMTKAESARASSYEKGDVLKVTSELKSLGLKKGDELRVEGAATKSMLSARTADNKEVRLDLNRVKGFEAYKEQKKEFAQGDKVMFTKNDKDVGVKNGETGKIEKIEGSKITIDRGGKDGKVTIDAKEYKHLDHAYAMTSHKSQGQTVREVMIHHNTESGHHAARESYVNVTRARETVKIYTNDREKAQEQASAQTGKQAATESSERGEKTAEKTGADLKTERLREVAEKREQEKTDHDKGEGKDPGKSVKDDIRAAREEAKAERQEQAKESKGSKQEKEDEKAAAEAGR
jgi:conjugative relaxase-like TrwC/TraI family protein